MVLTINTAERLTMIKAIISDIEWHKEVMKKSDKKEYHESEIKMLEELRNKLNQTICQ